MIRLITPSTDYYQQYKEMMDEWHDHGSRIAPWSLDLPYSTAEEYVSMVQRVLEVERGENLGEYAPSSTYWLYDDISDKLIGAGNLRHWLTEEGRLFWGHIGYGIRPSKRRNGYAALLLKLLLEKAAEHGISEVLLGSYEENVGSWKTMEHCGAIHLKTVSDPVNHLPIRQYIIHLQKRG